MKFALSTDKHPPVFGNGLEENGKYKKAFRKLTRYFHEFLPPETHIEILYHQKDWFKNGEQFCIHNYTFYSEIKRNYATWLFNKDLFSIPKIYYLKV